MKNKYIGDKQFYKMVLGLAVPIMIQNAISNFVGLLDNLMIGRIGTNALSGVAISNQLLFVFYLLIFGAIAGVGIFTAQFYGMKDIEGVRYTFRFKIIVNMILTILGILFFLFFSKPLIGTYLLGEGSPEDALETLNIGMDYMRVMLIGLIPYSIAMAYAGTLRETGETKVPMKASMIAVLVNLVGNFILIYGFFGFPALGAVGAAIATVVSRVVELLILIIYTKRHSDKHEFIKNAFADFKVPMYLVQKMIPKSLPLIVNETLWATGTTFMNQCYSYRSLSAVAALNIESTLWNLLGVAFLAMGDGVGIIIGQTLGAGEVEKAKDEAIKLLAFTTLCGVIFGVFQVALSPFFPMLYNTSNDVRMLATKFILVYGALMPLYAYTHASYFTIRAGGRTGITFLFDSCFVWVVSVPAAFFLSRFTRIDVVLMVVIVQALEIIKCTIGGIMVHSGIWAKVLVGEK